MDDTACIVFFSSPAAYMHRFPGVGCEKLGGGRAQRPPGVTFLQHVRLLSRQLQRDA